MLDTGDVFAPYVDPPDEAKSSKDKGKRRERDKELEHASAKLKALPLSSPHQQAQQDPMTPTSISRVVAQVLEIVPDVERNHLHTLITQHATLYNIDAEEASVEGFVTHERILEAVLHTLLESPDYPKAVQKAPPSRAAGPSNVPQPAHPPAGNTSNVPAPSRAINRSSQSEQDVTKILDIGPFDDADERVDPSVTVSANSKGKERSPALPAPDAEQDARSRIVTQVLEIIPDVDPSHVLKLVGSQLGVHLVDEEQDVVEGLDVYDRALQGVLHLLFENPNYPKVSKKRKRSSDHEGESPSAAKTRKIEDTDYGSKHRPRIGGKYYDELALVSRCYFLSCSDDHI